MVCSVHCSIDKVPLGCGKISEIAMYHMNMRQVCMYTCQTICLKLFMTSCASSDNREGERKN